MMVAKHQSGGPLVLGVRGWWKYYSNRHVHPDRADNYGKTPLSCDIVFEHDGVVKTLCRREEVNPDKPDNAGLTPLSYAAQNGHDGVTALLLSHKAVAPSTV